MAEKKLKAGARVLVPGVVAPVSGYNTEWERVEIQTGNGRTYFDILTSELVRVPEELPKCPGSIVAHKNSGRSYEYMLRSKGRWVPLDSTSSEVFSNAWFQDKDWEIVWDRGAQNG